MTGGRSTALLLAGHLPTRVVDEGSALVAGGAGVAEEQAINNDARVTTVQMRTARTLTPLS